MIQPALTEYDAWRVSPISQWFFEHYLQGLADAQAAENGRSVGLLEDSKGKEFMTFVRNAGVISGLEQAINEDPFLEGREERENEVNIDRTEPDSEAGL